MGLHKSKLSYGIGLPLELDRSEPKWPDGMSGDVRVRYFDPSTGKPMKAKPETAHRKLRKAARVPKERNVPARKWSVKVMVDGTEYPSISKAARAVGCHTTTLGEKLRAGVGEYRGHSIGIKEEDHGR